MDEFTGIKHLHSIIITLFVFILGTFSPNFYAVEKIEQGVYEKELGEDIGATKFKCGKLGGDVIVIQGQRGCIIKGGKL